MADQTAPQEGYISVVGARLYYRAVGRGRPVIVLHGGPDFDHSYLLPDLDRLSDTFRLIYYDQRGRGRSAAGVRPDEVTMGSDVADLESVREYFGVQPVVVLGHSWGGLLALEYAISHPQRVSHLVLLNTAPASHYDLLLFRQKRRESAPQDMEMLKTLASSAEYKAGDPDAVAGYYLVHFRSTLRGPEHLQQVIRSLRSSFTQEGILKARAIEERLLDETWLRPDYSLIPKLRDLNMPALVIHGEHDFVPVEAAAHVAGALPRARFVLLEECGHFSYLECAGRVREFILEFLTSG